MPLKAALHHMLRILGFYSALRYVTRRHPIIIVYHRFGPGEGNRKYVGQNVLSRQLAFIKKRCRLIGLQDLFLNTAKGQTLPDNAVAVTIDDGYEDFYRYALPVFRAHQVPATLFVVSDFVDRTKWLWPDIIEYAVRYADDKRFSLQVSAQSHHYDFSNPEMRHRAWNKLADHALDLNDDDCRKFVAQVVDTLGVSLPDHPTREYAAMTWEQVRAAHGAGIEIGSHTCTHPRLTRVDDRQLKDELRRSKEKIEQELEAPVTSFCYPFGRKADIDTKVKCAVETAGYRYATIGYYNLAVLVDPYEMKRVGASNDMADFTKKIMGWETLSTFLANRQYDR